jgi:GNAT superfamily N-acetyltransferase
MATPATAEERATAGAAGSVEIVDAGAGPARRHFLELPGRLHRDDPHWLPKPAAEAAAELDRPELTGRSRALVARAGGEPVARCIALLSALEDPPGSPLGMVGFFEAADHPRAVRALLDEAAAWLARRGARRVIGPIDGDTWHSYRINIGPWEEPPFLMEPWNPVYYPRLWEEAGFAAIEEYISLRVEDVAAAEAALAARAAESAARGYRLRPLRLRRFGREIDLLYELSREIFRDNYLFTEIPRREFRRLYAPARRLLEARLVWFAESPAGEPVGFVFAFRDARSAVAAARHRPGIAGRLLFLLRRRDAAAVDIKTLGVLPEHRRGRVAAALMHRVYAESRALGLGAANMCLIRDGNPSARLDGGEGRLLRRYRLYARETAP